MSDAIEYCEKCDSNIWCHMERQCINEWLIGIIHKSDKESRLERSQIKHHMVARTWEGKQIMSMYIKERNMRIS